jgi:hypothetical protein
MDQEYFSSGTSSAGVAVLGFRSRYHVARVFMLKLTVQIFRVGTELLISETVHM